MTHDNPFADFGCAVSDSRFLGREGEIRELENRLLGKKAFGSVALIGMPRTGKTSLVGEFVRRNKARCTDFGILVIRIEVGSFGNADNLFRGIIEEILDESRLQPFVCGDLLAQIERLSSSNEHSFNVVRRIFKHFRRHSLRVLCILDEFDSGRYLLRGTPEVFHWIRELSSTPEIKGSIVLISKRTLHEVARLAGHDSDYWSNVLMSIAIKSFSSDDMALWVERLVEEGISLSDKCLAAAEFWCGQNPFLLDVFAFNAWEAVSRGYDLSPEWIASVMQKEAIRYYKQVITVLQDGDKLKKVMQILIGPQWDVSLEDRRVLCEYGILRQSECGFRGFCDGFSNYLDFVRQDVDIWPLWSETESGIRSYLQERLINRFGEEWVASLKAAQPKLIMMLDDCEQKAQKEREKYGERASKCLLDYSYPFDLYRIMCADWKILGAPLLGSDKTIWAAKLTLLSKIRTPISHNRGEVVEEGEKKQAEGFCMEILQRLKKVEKTGRDI